MDEDIIKGEMEMSRIFSTTQNDIMLPTKYLIKRKETDFRILLLMILISNIYNNTISDYKSRYCTIKEVDANMDNMCKAIGITRCQFRKWLRVLLQLNSEEFRVAERTHKGRLQYVYEINYKKDGFVIIPREKVEIKLIGLNSTCIKLYANLLWLYVKQGDFEERQITQKYLCELMGLKTPRVVKVATDTLVKQGLITIKKEWRVETQLVSGLPISTTPKETIIYSIV